MRLGPLKIFRNDKGKLTPWNPLVESREQGAGSREFPAPRSPLPAHGCPLSRLSGWWNGVATGDFDGDGRLDIVASNWGQNTRYENFRSQPLAIYYGDLVGNGTIQTVEAYFDAAKRNWMPLQPFHLIGAAMPTIRERLGTYESYARSTLDQIYRQELKNAKQLEANWLESTVFLNRGDHFEARMLPVEAQMAPAFAVCAADLDGDGNEDLFLSQNFFAVPAETSRYDGGRGLWLRGDGKGAFRAVRGQESGVKVYGEQRGAALCDYDADGRLDLAVTQNGSATKLYHNVIAKPGLRVRLVGPVGNPSGVGASIRLEFGQRTGPVREAHAGNGYWSQDSAVQVLGIPQPPTQILVRWPGGKTTTTAIPAGAKEISLAINGELKVLR
ncbi:MAG: hypothetical protein DME26_11490 [Verrucomicrobia bacterium]|nr:MAG: hypothetical protein DME26_11490 [Verrucomicrobiota bacterium]